MSEPESLGDILEANEKLSAYDLRGPAGKANRARHDDKEIAKVQVLGMLKQGYSVEQCMDAVGRSRKTFYYWTSQSARFRAAVDAARDEYIRNEAKEEITFREMAGEFEPIVRANYSSWAAYVVAFRKAYFGFDTFDHQWQILQAW